MQDFQKTAVEILDRLVALEHGRQQLVDQMWARIPSYIESYANNAAQAANTALVVQPSSAQKVRITRAVATIPANATGVVQLGDRIFYLQQGVTSIPLGGDGDAGVMLSEGDVRAVTATVTGPVSLWLGGSVMPMFGTFA